MRIIKKDIGDALKSLTPSASFVIRDGVLEWVDEVVTQPTEVEIDAEIIKLQAEWDAQEYARDRKSEYDALNQFELISDDTNNGTTTHIDAINAIKTKYPKP
jgi:hypothetical protein